MRAAETTGRRPIDRQAHRLVQAMARRSELQPFLARDDRVSTAARVSNADLRRKNRTLSAGRPARERDRSLEGSPEDRLLGGCLGIARQCEVLGAATAC